MFEYEYDYSDIFDVVEVMPKMDDGFQYDHLIKNEGINTGPEKMHHIARSANVAGEYVLKNTRRKNKKSTVIGLVTVVILVTFLIVLENTIKKAPVIFLRLSEMSSGEMDLSLSPKTFTGTPGSNFTTAGENVWRRATGADAAASSSSAFASLSGLNSVLGGMFFNWTYIDEKMSGLDFIEGTTPRWTMISTVHYEPQKKGEIEANETDDPSAIFTAIDSDREAELEIGRNWELPRLNASECYVSKALLNRMGLGLAGGYYLDMKMDFLGLMSSLGSGNSSTPEEILAGMISTMTGIPLKVSQNVSVKIPDDVYEMLQEGTIKISLPEGDNITGETVENAYEQTSRILGLIYPNLTMPSFNETALKNITQNMSYTPGGNISVAIKDYYPDYVAPENDTYVQEISIDLAAMFADQLSRIADALVLRHRYRVAGSINDTEGKFSSVLGNILVVEADEFEPVVQDFLANVVGTVSGMLRDVADDLRATADALNVTVGNYSSEGLAAVLRAGVAEIDGAVEYLEGAGVAENFRLREYAMTTVAQIKDRRKRVYFRGFDEQKDVVVEMTNDIVEALGDDFGATITAPVHAGLETYYYVEIFLNQIFLFCLVIMVFLVACLVYSLLLADSEAKTYEYGMLRALGLKQYVLVELLSFQSLLFAIPGILVGVLLGWVIYLPIGSYIASFSSYGLDMSLNSTAVILAVVLGFVMPIIANVVPIKRALSNTLRDALDIYHQVTSTVRVSVMKLETIGLSPIVLACSIVCVVCGFVAYYLIPMSFTFSDMSMFFTILTVILIATLFGLSMMAMSVQPLFEHLLAYVLVWGPGYEAKRTLVNKNLSGHGQRNAKTAIMLTTSFAFIIFAGALFGLLSSILLEFFEEIVGSDVTVRATYIDKPLDEAGLRAFLDSEIRSNRSVVQNYTFVTFPLGEYPFVTSAYASTLIGYPSNTINVYGVERHYLHATYDNFVELEEKAGGIGYEATPDGKPDVIRSLYDDAGEQVLSIEKEGPAASGELPPSIISGKYGTKESREEAEFAYTSYADIVGSTALRSTTCIDTDTPIRLDLRYNPEGTPDIKSYTYLAKARAFANSVPGFFFSKYSILSSESPTLLNIDKFDFLLRTLHKLSGSTTTLADVPLKRRLAIGFRDGVSAKEREEIVNSLYTYVSDDTMWIIDTNGFKDMVDMAVGMLDVFFLVVALLAGFLCFFVLWLSFTANVNENAWEFAVLRSVGLTANQVISVYVYEALAIVISSVIFGTVIGIITAIVETNLFCTFLDLGVRFIFPTTLFFPILAMSIIIAVVGSYIPATIIRYRPIGSVLKEM